MARKTILDENLESYLKDGYKIFKYGSGIPSTDKRSKMGKTMSDAQLAHPKSDVRGVYGGRAGQRRTEGYRWAIVYKGK